MVFSGDGDRRLVVLFFEYYIILGLFLEGETEGKGEGKTILIFEFEFFVSLVDGILKVIFI